MFFRFSRVFFFQTTVLVVGTIICYTAKNRKTINTIENMHNHFIVCRRRHLRSAI